MFNTIRVRRPAGALRGREVRRGRCAPRLIETSGLCLSRQSAGPCAHRTPSLASGRKVKALGLNPLARLVAYGHAGVEPSEMGMGPVPATRLALERAGLSVHDLDVIESNEAFAAQACAVTRELDLDPAKVNPNGSGISLGHPVGATGAVITTKALYELQRSGGRNALVTMCIGGGQGIAAVFERV